MKTLKQFLTSACIIMSGLLGIVAGQQSAKDLSEPYFGQNPPGNIPQLFVPPELQSNEDWFWHGSLAFSPDNTEFYMDIYYPNANPSGMKIRKMLRIENQWTGIQPASFAGEYVAAGMSFTNNGNTVYFISDRSGGAFWKSNKINGTWGQPQTLNWPNPANLGSGWRMSVANSGRIYMHMASPVNNDFNIYAINYNNGQYSAPQRMSDSINSEQMEINAFIDPDEAYIIFESDRGGSIGEIDLYISFHKPDNSWTTARNMGSPVNTQTYEMSPYVSTDKQYLFFLSERDGHRNPYWVSANVIDSLRSVSLSAGGNRIFQTSGYFKVFPTPSTGIVNISFHLEKSAILTIQLYDILGNLIETPVNNSSFPSGPNSFIFERIDISPGVYYFVLKEGNRNLKTCKVLFW